MYIVVVGFTRFLPTEPRTPAHGPGFTFYIHFAPRLCIFGWMISSVCYIQSEVIMTRKPAPGRTDDRGPRTIWLTDDEWEALGLIADADGKKDRTKYIRAVIAKKIKAIRKREAK